MADWYKVNQTERTRIDQDDLDGPATVTNYGPNTVYYGGAGVSSVSYTGTLTQGQSLTIPPGYYFVSAGRSRLFVDDGSEDERLFALESRGTLTTAPQSPVYFGNATSSEYTSEPNIPIQVKTYHGNSGGYPVTGRPQGIQIISKYFALTTADSAQAGSAGAFLVDTGTPFTQTLPLTGMEGDAVTQGGNTLSNKAVGVSGSAEAQGTSHINDAICFYAAAKSASAAGASIDRWHGVYVENPTVVGTVTDNMGVYSKPRIQTETSVVIGTTQANTTAAIKGTTLHIVGTNTTGNPAVHVVKKSGSNDDIVQFSSSGAQPLVRVNGSGQFAIHAAGGAISYGSSAGAMLAIGNITTPPSANYSGGSGGFLYVESGALKFRGGSGTVTTVAAA